MSDVRIVVLIDAGQSLTREEISWMQASPANVRICWSPTDAFSALSAELYMASFLAMRARLLGPTGEAVFEVEKAVLHER